MNENKRYTFLNMKRCIGKENKEYVGVTAELMVVKPELKTTQNGKTLAVFDTPINNRGKAIERMCGKTPYENNDGTCWARVTLWDNEYNQLATRFNNFMDKNSGKTVVLIVTGMIKATESQGKDGKTYVNVNITADDFTVRGVYEKNGNGGSYNGGNNGNGASNGNGGGNSGGYNQPKQGTDSMTNNGGFFSADELDDFELPF